MLWRRMRYGEQFFILRIANNRGEHCWWWRGMKVFVKEQQQLRIFEFSQTWRETRRPKSLCISNLFIFFVSSVSVSLFHPFLPFPCFGKSPKYPSILTYLPEYPSLKTPGWWINTSSFVGPFCLTIGNREPFKIFQTWTDPNRTPKPLKKFQTVKTAVSWFSFGF